MADDTYKNDRDDLALDIAFYFSHFSGTKDMHIAMRHEVHGVRPCLWSG